MLPLLINAQDRFQLLVAWIGGRSLKVSVGSGISTVTSVIEVYSKESDNFVTFQSFYIV